MRKMSTKKIDCASEYIIALQSLMQKPALTNKELELGLIQQFLDDEALNIKQIPRVAILASKMCRIASIFSVHLLTF
jgi:hypothetical protein